MATVFVWLTGLIFSNTSIYDPYWSVAPPVYFTSFFISFKTAKQHLASFLLLASVWIWGIRLTLNWAKTFTNLSHQDWRYQYFKDHCHFLIWHIINFFGLNLIPTIVVFLAMLPGYDILNYDIYYLQQNHAIVIIGFFLSLTGVLFEHLADTQLREFRRTHENGRVCNVGLWKYSRHPNYLGEIMMWWGVYIMSLNSTFPRKFPIGAVANTILFTFVSIPLMERRQLKNKPDYIEYKKRTGMLLPKIF
ncbi:putative membrane protein [Tritrichomonas foetus]|uniref:Membrane protein n=1 Tax=Tritrichomonas foetus TaxID=1144522 RepID=A0A1J4JQ27_9EUKA|nr:putative membrane protein [Tritrichomonas foetus]|eukprot:OHT01263.1 putative membrane protein [Tritrichomonas foetus]